MFKRVIYSNILLTIRKGLKISMVEVFKNSILIMIKNIKCKGSRIELIKKKLLLNIYYYIYQIKQKLLRISTGLYLGKLG